MGEEIEPGLEGFSDSGSDYYDLPAPELPGGIERTLVKEASGVVLKRPQEGDEVAVHYVARRTSGGEAFDSSRERGEPLRFVLGRGQASRGLELAITTMRLGEVARFRLSPELACGAALAALSPPPEGRSVVYELELVDWVSCRDLLGDGSVTKRLLRRAEDKRRSKVGDVCLCSCALSAAAASGAAPGEQLAELPELENIIGDGSDSAAAAAAQPLAGAGPLRARVLDEALLSMRRGERCTLHSSAAVAFGEAAALPSGLLPDSQVVIELELREFLDTTDISFEKDGSVIKRSLRSRDAWPRCQDAGRCSLLLLAARHGDEVLASDRRLAFTIGNGEVCDVLECAAASMREGEEAVVTCSRAEMCEEPLLGLAGRQGLQLHLRVETYETRPGETSRRGGEKMEYYRTRKDRVKLEFYKERKESATALFRAGRHRLAAYRFRQIYELLGYLDDYRGAKAGDAQKAEVAELKKVCMLNRAICALKAGNHRGAVDACDVVLDMEPQNPKALFRRARALLGLERCVEAVRDARAALHLEPKSAEIKKLLVDIKGRQRVDDGETKPMYAKMCSGLGSLPHPLDVD